MRALTVVLSFLVAVAALPVRVAPAAAATLPSQLDALAGAFPGQAAVWIADPAMPDPIYVRDPDEKIVAASLYKLAVLAEAEHQVDLGHLRYGDTITIDQEDITDDGSFEAPGTDMTIDEALEAMITVSDNGAAVHLWRQLGPQNINEDLQRNGITDFHVRLDDTEDNLASARAVGHLFTLLATGKLVSKAASERMIARLARQQINDRIPAELPDGTVVAHKTGNLVGYTHDAGIIYTAHGPRVVVAMTWDVDEGSADAFIAHLASTVLASTLSLPALPHYSPPFLDGGRLYAETGSTIAVPIGVANAGSAGWTLTGPGQIGLVWELRDGYGVTVSRAAKPLPLGQMPPGAATSVPVIVSMPPRPADLRLVVGLADDAGRPLAALGVATAAIPIRVHAPFVIEPVVRIPSRLHRREASLIEIDVTAIAPVRADDHELSLGWRLIHGPTDRVVARGTVPLGTLRTYERSHQFFAPLIAPNVRGRYTLEYEIQENGVAASVTGSELVQILSQRTYPDDVRLLLPPPQPRLRAPAGPLPTPTPAAAP